jgi:phosphate transport system protein
MTVHTVQRFDEDLDKLRSRLIKMCTLVQQQMSFALKALAGNDKQLAELIIVNDDKIDKVDIKIDKKCMEIFAVHQPFASDLRLVLTALSINDLFELIGDTIVDIAKSIIELQAYPFLIKKTMIIQMGEETDRMLSKVIDSYIYGNTNLAKESFEIIQNIKALRKQNVEMLAGIIKEDPEYAITCLSMQDISRNLKIISDLSVNIGQEIVFLEEARNIKHMQLKQKQDADNLKKENEE